MDRREAVQNAVEGLLTELGVDLDDENFRETPRRFTTYLLDHFIDEADLGEELASFSSKVFPSPYEGMIVQRISAIGVCPHHILPVIYTGSLGYIPSECTVGLSKLSRIAKVCLSRPMLQETATQELATVLENTLRTPSVAVLLRAKHMCIAIRGVKEMDTVTITSELRGAFLEKPAARAEFMQLVEYGNGGD